ncbi:MULTISPECIES: hypothetical protein [unclassified Olleya]|jgi:hypothetical protein|uniref:hypothetical protein n=1 Tax=unclassified Olleya TaxID=2615019 RepID=UPI00119CC87E|nr:hypothetical protein [Olleya sp. Hel_I_94]TVZ46194.1 hypothetical protein JM82_0762 [Olleya sp. Hel_I_94]|tara:strand:- start:25724 stop:26359 length:636 start_codon:yes stop_codon:yes gene_type:complete
MKKTLLILLLISLYACDSTQLRERWISPDASDYTLQKVFIVALSNNQTAKSQFEKKLQKQLVARGIDASVSLDKFDADFLESEKTDAELKVLENQLIEEGFDAVIFTKVAGIKNKIQYKKDYSNFDKNHKKFNDDFLMYQDQVFNPDAYKEYQVYNAETSVYCLCPTKDRTLIWKGYIDIVDPENIDQTVNDYSKLLTLVLENDGIIPEIE